MLEVVSFTSVEITVFQCFAQLLFQTRDAHRCLSFLLLAPSSESGRGSRVALSLLVSNFGRSLNIHRNLHVMTLLAFNGHDLNAALAGRGHGYPTALHIHSHGDMMRIWHR
jgi:hypothetical protein